jgi:hypothetical protein
MFDSKVRGVLIAPQNASCEYFRRRLTKYQRCTWKEKPGPVKYVAHRICRVGRLERLLHNSPVDPCLYQREERLSPSGKKQNRRMGKVQNSDISKAFAAMPQGTRTVVVDQYPARALRNAFAESVALAAHEMAETAEHTSVQWFTAESEARLWLDQAENDLSP